MDGRKGRKKRDEQKVDGGQCTSEGDYTPPVVDKGNERERKKEIKK